MRNERERIEFDEIRREEALGKIALLIRQNDLTAQELLSVWSAARQAGQTIGGVAPASLNRPFDPFFDAW